VPVITGAVGCCFQHKDGASLCDSMGKRKKSKESTDIVKDFIANRGSQESFGYYLNSKIPEHLKWIKKRFDIFWKNWIKSRPEIKNEKNFQPD